MAYWNWTSDDRCKYAIGVTASAEDAEYPAENLISEDPAEPAKLTDTTGDWVVEFADKQKPVGASLIYQYLDEALTNVKIQANDTDSWGAPAFERTFEIPMKRQDGPDNQQWTNNVQVWWEATDLPDLDGYLFWRLVIEDANSQAVAIGRLLLNGAKRRTPIYHAGEIRGMEDPDVIIHETERRVRIVTPIGGPQRSLTIYLIGTDLDAGSLPIQEAQEFRQLHQQTNGGANPFPFWPFEDEPWLVYFEETPYQIYGQGGEQIWVGTIREVSRGLPWP